MAGTRGVTNPVVDYKNGGSLRDWPQTLDGVLKLDIDIVIPGHGEISTREGLVAHRNKIASIRDRSAVWYTRENRRTRSDSY